MAPRGAPRRPVTPGPDPLALITGTLFFLLPMVLPTAYGLPTRTERLISENDLFYAVDGQDGQILCLLCPAGTYVKEDCTVQYTRGTCEICQEGTFSQYASGLSECLRCDTCRDDQEEVSHCFINKNTVCQCKKGTFCPSDQPCEICMPCTGSCPEDEVVKAPCNSTSDRECTPPSSSTSTRDIIITCVVLFIVLIAIIIAVCVYRKKKSTDAGTKLFGKGNEDHDETKRDLIQRHIILQFKEGTDKDTKEEIISKSWPIIVREVPIKGFENLMYSLGLSPNDVDTAKIDNPSNVNNQHSAMLQAWYHKGEFDINKLLKALQNLDMEKAANEIKHQLTREELYIEQSQP
ncbi:tumor necrosis factor receptor superfamily member 6-like isoform X2 [Lithobates pipiens]